MLVKRMAKVAAVKIEPEFGSPFLHLIPCVALGQGSWSALATIPILKVLHVPKVSVGVREA